MAEQICANFTEKTYLVPHSDKFECQGQRLTSPLTRGKKTRCALRRPPGSDGMECAFCK